MNPPARFSRRHVVWPLLVAATIFIASSRSHIGAPGIPNFDKVAHFSVYGLLATLPGRLGRRPRAAWLALLATSVYGASDEWHQYYVPGRSCDVMDWLADTTGAALALALYRWWPWYRARPEAPLNAKRRIENPPPVTTVRLHDSGRGQQKITALRAEVARHDELYHRRAQPEISDFDYDRLKRELADLEKAFPQFASADSPTQRVGDDRVQGFKEVAHRQKMLSLDNTYNETELRAFHTRLVKLLETDDLRYTVEPKIDGLAVSLTYEDGQLVRAVTRGKGDRGDDVTANVLTIASLPRKLPGAAPRIVEIRGEIYLTQAEFERINAERAAAGEELYANPRNTAAGTIKQLDTTEVAKRKLSIVLYSLGYCEPEVVSSQTELQKKLKAWGLPVVEKYWTVRGIDEAWAAIGELDGSAAISPTAPTARS